MSETYLTIIDASTGKTTIVKGQFDTTEEVENYMIDVLNLNSSDCEYMLTKELDLEVLGLKVRE